MLLLRDNNKIWFNNMAAADIGRPIDGIGDLVKKLTGENKPDSSVITHFYDFLKLGYGVGFVNQIIGGENLQQVDYTSISGQVDSESVGKAIQTQTNSMYSRLRTYLEKKLGTSLGEVSYSNINELISNISALQARVAVRTDNEYTSDLALYLLKVASALNKPLKKRLLSKKKPDQFTLVVRDSNEAVTQIISLNDALLKLRQFNPALVAAYHDRYSNIMEKLVELIGKTSEKDKEERDRIFKEIDSFVQYIDSAVELYKEGLRQGMVASSEDQVVLKTLQSIGLSDRQQFVSKIQESTRRLQLSRVRGAHGEDVVESFVAGELGDSVRESVQELLTLEERSRFIARVLNKDPIVVDYTPLFKETQAGQEAQSHGSSQTTNEYKENLYSEQRRALATAVEAAIPNLTEDSKRNILDKLFSIVDTVGKLQPETGEVLGARYQSSLDSYIQRVSLSLQEKLGMSDPESAAVEDTLDRLKQELDVVSDLSKMLLQLRKQVPNKIADYVFIYEEFLNKLGKSAEAGEQGITLTKIREITALIQTVVDLHEKGIRLDSNVSPAYQEFLKIIRRKPAESGLAEIQALTTQLKKQATNGLLPRMDQVRIDSIEDLVERPTGENKSDSSVIEHFYKFLELEYRVGFVNQIIGGENLQQVDYTSISGQVDSESVGKAIQTQTNSMYSRLQTYLQDKLSSSVEESKISTIFEDMKAIIETANKVQRMHVERPEIQDGGYFELFVEETVSNLHDFFGNIQNYNPATPEAADQETEEERQAQRRKKIGDIIHYNMLTEIKDELDGMLRLNQALQSLQEKYPSDIGTYISIRDKLFSKLIVLDGEPRGVVLGKISVFSSYINDVIALCDKDVLLDSIREYPEHKAILTLLYKTSQSEKEKPVDMIDGLRTQLKTRIALGHLAELPQSRMGEYIDNVGIPLLQGTKYNSSLAKFLKIFKIFKQETLDDIENAYNIGHPRDAGAAGQSVNQRTTSYDSRFARFLHKIGFGKGPTGKSLLAWIENKHDKRKGNKNIADVPGASQQPLPDQPASTAPALAVATRPIVVVAPASPPSPAPSVDNLQAQQGSTAVPTGHGTQTVGPVSPETTEPQTTSPDRDNSNILELIHFKDTNNGSNNITETITELLSGAKGFKSDNINTAQQIAEKYPNGFKILNANQEPYPVEDLVDSLITTLQRQDDNNNNILSLDIEAVKGMIEVQGVTSTEEADRIKESVAMELLARAAEKAKAKGIQPVGVTITVNSAQQSDIGTALTGTIPTTSTKTQPPTGLPPASSEPSTGGLER